MSPVDVVSPVVFGVDLKAVAMEFAVEPVFFLVVEDRYAGAVASGVSILANGRCWKAVSAYQSYMLYGASAARSESLLAKVERDSRDAFETASDGEPKSLSRPDGRDRAPALSSKKDITAW